MVEFDEILGDQIEPRRFGPPQRLHVAEPTVTILQVRFEPVRHVACGLLTDTNPMAEFGEMTITVAAPQRQPLLDDLRGEVVVAGQWPRRDERRCRVEVGGGEVELLVEAAHCVTELHPRVPQRVPDRTCERLDFLLDLLRLHVVDEQEVEVALRGQLASAVPADGQQRHPAAGALDPFERLVEDGSHPVVGDLCQRPAIGTSWSRHGSSDLFEMADTNR